MTKFDNIYEIAAGNYGLVTSSDAASVGVERSELARYANDGRLEHRGRGVYRLVRWIPTPYDRFAEAVALVGKDSMIFGDGVLAMLDLAFANPRAIPVATDRRVRKALPGWISLVRIEDMGQRTSYMGVPCQHVTDAILACQGRIMSERLIQAAKKARHEGWIDGAMERRLKRTIEQWHLKS